MAVRQALSFNGLLNSLNHQILFSRLYHNGESMFKHGLFFHKILQLCNRRLKVTISSRGHYSSIVRKKRFLQPSNSSYDEQISNSYQKANVSALTYCRLSTSSSRFKKSKKLSQAKENDSDESDDDEEIDESFLEDEMQQQIIREIYRIPGTIPRVFVIQPDVKWGAKKKINTTAELQLAEAVALLDTLNWTIVGKILKSTKQPDSKTVFGKGNFEELTEQITQRTDITAVFIGVNMLTGVQQTELEKFWKVSIYDRYTIVLQIFKEHARTMEAKLQISLAEIPYLKSRLRQLHEGKLDQQKGGMQYIGGSGETYLDIRIRLLREREFKIKKALGKLKKHRQLLRINRKKKDLPVVAIVGYTNSGKTTLIKSLTKDQSLEPKDHLFATLDVTAHAGTLPHDIKVLYMDTVGFIQDIPIHLVESFAATLEDTIQADVLVHVRDLSHPDTIAQKANVLSTLQGLKLPGPLTQNIIEVCNKCDLVQDPKAVDPNVTDAVFISATQGMGLTQLKQEIEKHIVMATGRMMKSFRIPIGAPEYNWLCEEAAVYHVDVDPEANYYNIHTIISEAAYGKFRHQYRKVVEIHPNLPARSNKI